MSSNPVVRQSRKLTKDCAKAHVSSALSRAVLQHGLDEVASAAVVTPRCIQKAMSHETLPEAHVLANIIDIDPAPYAALAEARGYRLVPQGSLCDTDVKASPAICALLKKAIEAELDGVTDHRELLDMERELIEVEQIIGTMRARIADLRRPVRVA